MSSARASGSAIPTWRPAVGERRTAPRLALQMHSQQGRSGAPLFDEAGKPHASSLGPLLHVGRKRSQPPCPAHNSHLSPLHQTWAARGRGRAAACCRGCPCGPAALSRRRAERPGAPAPAPGPRAPPTAARAPSSPCGVPVGAWLPRGPCRRAWGCRRPTPARCGARGLALRGLMVRQASQITRACSSQAPRFPFFHPAPAHLDGCRVEHLHRGWAPAADGASGGLCQEGKGSSRGSLEGCEPVVFVV